MYGSMRAFIDYQMERMNKSRIPHHIYIPKDNKVYRVRDEDIIDFLRSKRIREVYLENAPTEWLYNLLDNSFKIYILRFKRLIKEYRKKYNMKKNHENDATLLYIIYKDNPRKFGEYHKRELYDPSIQKYKAILRKIAKIRQMRDDGYEEYIEQLSVIEKKLLNEANKLYKRLKRKYKRILERFPEFEGTYGNLLYFMSLIPEVNSFRGARSFLIYLGLRTRCRIWNREARQALIEIAYKFAKKQGVKYKREKPNWKFIRKIALMIFQILRDGGG